MDDPGEGTKYHGISTLPSSKYSVVYDYDDYRSVPVWRNRGQTSSRTKIDRLVGAIRLKLKELKPLVRNDIQNKVLGLQNDFETASSNYASSGYTSDHDHVDEYILYLKSLEMSRKLDVLGTLVNEDIRPKVKAIEEDLDKLFDSSYAPKKYMEPGRTSDEVLLNVRRDTRQRRGRHLKLIKMLQRDISGLDKKLDDVLIRMSSLTDEQQNKSQVDRKGGLIHSLYIQPGLTPDQSPAKSDAEEGNTIDKKPTDRRKAEWTIDPQAWNNCIRSKDSSQIDALLRMKKIPNNNLLSEAKNTFHIKYVRNICDGICQYIVQKSYDIRHVYPAIKMDESRDRSQESITFVVIHGKHTNIDNIEFKLHIKRTGDFVYNDHDSMKEREKEREIFDEENDVELLKLANCLREHSQRLMKGHTNICRISCSETKSVRYGKDDELVPRAHCITIYVYAKGLIPLGEDMLPKTLIFEGYEALVDVQEGFVELYAGNEGPYDNLNHLRIGCSIGGDPHLNKENLHGTLGGFFDYAGKEFCMSSAHVFLSASEMVRLKEREKDLVERNDYIKNVYQPHNVYHKSFGKGRMAVYTEGGKGKTGVDVLSILVENRNPNSGEFPKSERGAAVDKTYSTGKVYNRDDIHDLLKKKNRIVMKYGCGTGWTTGTFRLDGAVFRAPHPVHDGDIHFNICLHNQFEIQSDTENAFAAKSDSGALVYMEDNDELVAIGMVVAGMADDVCFVTPLDEILKALGLDPMDGLKQFNSGVNKSTSDVSGVLLYNRNTTSINNKVTTLRSDFENMKDNVNVLTKNVNEIRNDMGDMKEGIGAILKSLTQGTEPTHQ